MIAFRFVLCVAVVVIGLSNVEALDKEAMQKIYQEVLPLITECSKEYGLEEDTLKNAKKEGNFDAIDKCFFACVFKKGGFLNDKGEFDADKANELSKKFLTEDEDLKNASEVTEDCSSVNKEDVSDGEAGCERALLLVKCIGKHKSKFFPGL